MWIWWILVYFFFSLIIPPLEPLLEFPEIPTESAAVNQLHTMSATALKAEVRKKSHTPRSGKGISKSVVEFRT